MLNKVFMLLMFFLLFTTNSYAALDLSTITIDTSQVLVLAGVIVTAIASIWAVKKLIKLANRS